jgi:putative transposase
MASESADPRHPGSEDAPIRATFPPFVERLIGTVRREYLDQVCFQHVPDLERRLAEFQIYFNRSRVHSSLAGDTPAQVSGDPLAPPAQLHNFCWQPHCRGLYELPVAA